MDIEALTARAAERLAPGRVGAVVCVVAGGRTVTEAVGRTAEAGALPGPDTGFEIGSVTKVFTALLLARLAVDGRVDPDEPLAGLLDGAVVPESDGARITLRHLATHTSGLPRLPRGMLVKALLRPGTPDPYAGCHADVLLAGLERTRLRAAPGRRFHYSNLGAGLLGLALARRTGTGYAELLHREVCAPLGLGSTGPAGGPGGPDEGTLARGHTRRGVPTPYWDLADLVGAGGLRSTAADMARFVRAQLEPGATPLEQALESTQVRQPGGGAHSVRHLGWMGQEVHPRAGGGRLLWHNGGTGGFTSFVGFDPDRRVGVVALSNSARSVDGPALELLRRVRGAA
ncbi:serine hydrolase domain-containing protein [Kitasatospora sp. NPDC057015]|uniref:serine hydrolase domain-containing protein n=1 Tax=Kitasatospora sp. NPDC057015 TaxID=3346001 RepID=UPI00363BECB3